jgi:iron complex transport system ATP-binding protein
MTHGRLTGGATWASSRDGSERPEVAFEIQGLRFRYGSPLNPSARWALDELSFEIRAGEILGVVGPNGSGKTTLLKILAKILRATEGSIRLFGKDLAQASQLEVAQLVALMLKESPLLFPFTVAEVVLMGRYPHRRASGWTFGLGCDSPEDLALAEQVMVEMDIAHLAGRLITELSSGECQRALLARALVQEPRVLLLDEPTAALDLPHEVELCSMLCRLKADRNLTIVLVTHDLNLASHCGDRILMLKDGKMVCLGDPEHVIRPEVLQAVYRCGVVVDRDPASGRPRVTLPYRQAHVAKGPGL